MLKHSATTVTQICSEEYFLSLLIDSLCMNADSGPYWQTQETSHIAELEVELATGIMYKCLPYAKVEYYS